MNGASKRALLLFSAAYSFLSPWLVACKDDLGELAQRPPTGPERAPSPIGFEAAGDAGSQPEAIATSIAPGQAPPPGVDVEEGEPRRDRALTLVHGIVDAQRIGFCLLWEGSDTSRLSGVPVPNEGLYFGQSVALSGERLGSGRLKIYVVAWSEGSQIAPTCESALEDSGYAFGPAEEGEVLQVLESSSVLPENPWILPTPEGGDAGVASGLNSDAGDLQQQLQTGELDGGQADAGVGLADAAITVEVDGAVPETPSPEARVPFSLPVIRARALTELSEASVSEEFSYLMVASGCIGAAGLAAALGPEHCGSSFPAQSSTLTPVFVPMSRAASFEDVGLQVVNANQAFPLVTVRSSPSEGADGAFFTVARDLPLGAVAPRPALRGISPEEVGEDLSQVVVDIAANPTGEALLSVPWDLVLALGGVSGLERSREYSLVVLGAAIGVPPGPWNNPGFITIVDNDPATAMP